ncbi:enoyl-CoA hydratase/isomerase family protein [Rhodoligotrophos ferricapiens]|uniref:enoyl-CoA hydratase/isomerase family protein n=1 Tax=Rhodoligotrophos ferricapiens TaxID=3069264 RepID=UPI00315D3922
MAAVNEAAGDQQERVLCAVEDGVATITLNRPDQLNPLDRLTVAALLEQVQQLEADGSVSIIVLRGAGRAFSAGGDLEGYMQLYRDRPEFMKFLRNFNLLLEEIERSEKIYVAVVHGHCVAGGLELMLACDIVLAAHEAQIADGHLNFAQLPGAGGSQRLPRAIGALKAKLLVLTGRTIGGEEAERIGLASLSVPRSELEAALDGLIADLKRKSPLGLKGAKYLINTGGLGARDAALELELHYVHHYATTSHDAYEGLAAFKEKRKPDLKGE